MASRMDKYYNNDDTKAAPKRASRNQSLYQKIDKGYEYSNVEGVTNIDSTNEIDLTKIRKLLKIDEEKEKKVNHYYEEEIEQTPEVEKKYNLTDILQDAKTSRVDDEKQRSLSDTHFDLLKSLEESKIKEVKVKSENDGLESLEELIHTITNSKVLEGMNDKELGLDILDDLKETGNTTKIDSDSIQSIIEDAKKENFQKTREIEPSNLDESFYTSSFNFKDGDFEDFKDLNKAINKNSILIKVSMYVLLGIVAAFVGFLIFNFIK